jgi:hypothetical protein
MQNLRTNQQLFLVAVEVPSDIPFANPTSKGPRPYMARHWHSTGDLNADTQNWGTVHMPTDLSAP